MEKLRSVNTKFWNDAYIETLDSKEKLLFLYLLTNPLANILGIYEITINRISFETGLTIENINKALKGFESVQKVFYLDGFIILANFQKNQNMNSNMEKGAKELFNKLPNRVKSLVLDKALKGFERLSNGFKDFEKYESESELQSENENEIKKENKIPIVLNFSKINPETWKLWVKFKKEVKKFTYKPEFEQIAVDKLIKLSKDNPEAAHEIVLNSIANGYDGLFELKINSTKKTEPFKINHDIQNNPDRCLFPGQKRKEDVIN